jgi:hypothetical protein
MRYKPNPKFMAERRQLDKMSSERSRRTTLAKETAAADTNALEAYLLRKSGWGRGLAKVTKKLLNAHTPHATDDIGQLKSAKKLQGMPWPTTVDWDGRATYEKDKKVIAQPVMQHYLKRMKPWMYK